VKKSRKKVIIILIIVFIVVIAAAVLILRIGKTKQSSTAVVPPTTVKVKNGDIDERVTASGTIQPTDEKSIFIELSEDVKKVYADVGDKVEKGQLLVTYDTDNDKKELEDKVKSAQISLDNAELELNQMVKPAEGTELIELKSAAQSAQKDLDSANKAYSDNEDDIKKDEDDMDYYKQMITLGGMSQSDYDDFMDDYNGLVKNRTTLQSNIKTCKLALEKAQLNLEYGQDRLKDSSTKESYEKQKNAVETAKMNLDEAKTNLSKLAEATYSPISGTILENSAVAGQMLTDSTAIMKIADLTNLDVLAYVSEYDIAKVEVGQEVELTSDGIENKTYHGHVTKIEPSAESKSTISGSETVVPVLVHMDDNDELVKPGFEFDMEIIVASLSNVNYIPVSSVMKNTKTNSYYVFVVGDDNILKKKTVELGISSDMYMQLISGLESSDVILESPDSSVKEGSNLMDYATVKEGTSTSSSSGGFLSNLFGGGKTGQSGGGPGGGGEMPSGGGEHSGGNRSSTRSRN
jgi:HlyD family secretion protein